MKSEELMVNVKLHIKQLVLHGFSFSDRYEISGAVERELARLMSEGELVFLPDNSASFYEIDAGSFEVAAHSTPGVIGSQVAQNIYQGMWRNSNDNISGIPEIA